VGVVEYNKEEESLEGSFMGALRSANSLMMEMT